MRKQDIHRLHHGHGDQSLDLAPDPGRRCRTCQAVTAVCCLADAALRAAGAYDGALATSSKRRWAATSLLSVRTGEPSCSRWCHGTMSYYRRMAPCYSKNWTELTRPGRQANSGARASDHVAIRRWCRTLDVVLAGEISDGVAQCLYLCQRSRATLAHARTRHIHTSKPECCAVGHVWQASNAFV